MKIHESKPKYSTREPRQQHECLFFHQQHLKEELLVNVRQNILFKDEKFERIGTYLQRFWITFNDKNRFTRLLTLARK